MLPSGAARGAGVLAQEHGAEGGKEKFCGVETER